MAEEESLSSFNSWSSSRCRDIFSFSTEALSQEASSCFDLSRADSFDILTQLYLESSGQSSLQTAATEQSQIQMDISETSHDSLKDLTDCLFQSHQNPSSESTMDEEVQILSPQFDCLIPSQTSLFWSSTDTPAKLNATAPRDSFLPEAKKLRLETPSPLPTFKVRKEKLGDRITALQQLVSPFGKTDTASVLHEAIEYIKFLHQQVNILERQHKNGKCWEKKDLRSLGLCLVPISSTAAVTRNEVPPLDFFWTQLWGSPQ